MSEDIIKKLDIIGEMIENRFFVLIKEIRNSHNTLVDLIKRIKKIK